MEEGGAPRRTDEVHTMGHAKNDGNIVWPRRRFGHHLLSERIGEVGILEF